jgi:hypothetical protein
MTSARDHLGHQDDRIWGATTRRAPDAVMDPAISGPGDPRLVHGSPGPGLLHLQRTAGNAAVRSLVAPAVQRVVGIDELTSEVAPDAGAGAEAAAGPAADAGPVTSAGGTTTVSGTAIRLEAPMTSTDGVIRASTIIADSVVASNYTPGAGNVW